MFSIETHITCDFRGGVRTPYPPSGSAHDCLVYKMAYETICSECLSIAGFPIKVHVLGV